MLRQVAFIPAEGIMLAFVLLITGLALQGVGAERAAERRETRFSLAATGSFSRLSSKHEAKLSAVLATDQSVAAHSAVAAASNHQTQGRLHQALTVSSGMIPREAMKCLMACTCLLILFKLLSTIDCYSKKLDCRRCKFIARFLMHIGWDEFTTFRATVTVHSVADIVNKGMMGGEKVFKVKVAWRWSQFITTSTADMKWEQTKGMDVPQGADECVITLYSEGKIKDTYLGEYVLETKKDMIDAKKFWGTKKKLKFENKGKLVGTISITFRNSEDDGEGGAADLPIEGVEQDSALAIAVREAYEEMVKDGIIQKPPPKSAPPPTEGAAPEGEEGAAPEAPAEAPPSEEEVPKLEGNQKIDCLGRCCTGPLREVNSEGKEAGKAFIRVINCNFAELQGDDMKAEMAKQMRKAQEKGLQSLPRKWYFVWYEDKKSAYHAQKWHEPDGYIPMTAISKINRQPERNDQFVITYSEDGSKNTLVYRRDGGKSLDVWVDGLDMCFNATRELVKEEKENEERRKRGLPPL